MSMVQSELTRILKKVDILFNYNILELSFWFLIMTLNKLSKEGRH